MNRGMMSRRYERTIFFAASPLCANRFVDPSNFLSDLSAQSVCSVAAGELVATQSVQKTVPQATADTTKQRR